MSRYPIVLALLVVPVAAVQGQSAADARWIERCRDNDDGWRVQHCEVRVVTLARGGTIAVDPGHNGGVVVEGWDRDNIEVHARIQTQAASDEQAGQLASQVKVVTSGTTISAEGPNAGRRESWGVSFLVYAPRRSDLKLDTDNGPIGVRDVTGRMTLTAHNGPVSLSGVGGDVHARTTNGPLDIDLTGARWDGAGLDAETTNGPVNLAVPEPYSAQLEFGTVNGPMTVAFPLTVTIQGRVGRRITTKLGDGGAPVRVVTTNGPVEIRRN
ncbi:MAG TPA: DUF4097 family beta strand repeat-containing protein [Gemmatimonadales bacterium]|nr:DUF4097 family beta strand repeat-containing protein [Gemmatimonadales bacterium]